MPNPPIVLTWECDDQSGRVTVTDYADRAIALREAARMIEAEMAEKMETEDA